MGERYTTPFGGEKGHQLLEGRLVMRTRSKRINPRQIMLAL